jgi:hypothetical protein
MIVHTNRSARICRCLTVLMLALLGSTPLLGGAYHAHAASQRKGNLSPVAGTLGGSTNPAHMLRGSLAGTGTRPADFIQTNAVVAGSSSTQATCSPAPGTSAYAGAVLANGPLGYWRFDETCKGQVSDRSGHGITGQALGGVTPGQVGAPLGDGDATMAFDGASGYVSLGDPASLQPRHVYVEAWVNTTSSNMPEADIVRKRLYGYDLFPTPAVQPAITVDDQRSTAYTAIGSAMVTDDRWHHLVGTYDGARVCIYADGHMASCQSAGTIYYRPGMTAIERAGGFGGYYFNGKIDDLAIYGVALSASQILTHCTTAIPPVPALVGCWVRHWCPQPP